MLMRWIPPTLTASFAEVVVKYESPEEEETIAEPPACLAGTLCVAFPPFVQAVLAWPGWIVEPACAACKLTGQ